MLGCFNFIMPGKEEKNQYPSCNRAFALRMMNPNSYRQGQVSPLDREIQPVVKRPVARSVSARSDDSPLSVSSSADTSYQDMELYDIDENGMVTGKNNTTSVLSSSFDGTMRPAKGSGDKTPNSPRKTNTDEFSMRRSLSSVEGFNQNSVLKRQHPARTTMPARIRNRGLPKDDSSSSTVTVGKSKLGFNGQLSANGKESPAQGKRFSTVNGKINTASPIMKDRKSRLDPPPDSRPRTPVTTNKVVKGTRASELRAKSRGADDNNRTNNNDIDKSVGKMNGKMNGHHQKSGSDDADADSMSDCSIDTVLKLCSPVTTSSQSSIPNSCSSPISLEVPQLDEFSTKLSEVCNLISEKHPGDFQILETLVTMQTAYEDRDKQVNKCIIGLHDRIAELEDKLRNSPNIPQLVLPLLKASNVFQKQLHHIFVSHKETLGRSNGHSSSNGHSAQDKLNGVVNGYNRVNPFEEIYMEANSVAEHILSRQNSRRKSQDESRLDTTAGAILSRQNSRRKSTDERSNELTNGHLDANTVAEKILSRQNSLKNKTNGDEDHQRVSSWSSSTISREDSLKTTTDEIHVNGFDIISNGLNPKINGYLNGHVNGDHIGKSENIINGSLERNGHAYMSHNGEHLV